MEDKCPFCGAGGKTSTGYFACSTHEKRGEKAMFYSQSSDCKSRQIAKLTASRDRWKELAEECIRYLIDHGYSMDFIALDEQAALRAAGEWEE